ncbi:MAG: hypothetical protein K2X93_04930 [Candidatus Obscuribacterales bacterium]|nr:hypothetical protein [Candidatus Obscuribacterales bacterium]
MIGRVFFTLTILLSAPSAMAVEQWETDSRLAHVLVENKKLNEAIHRYDQAIKLLKANGSSSHAPTIIDLELNKADALTKGQLLNEADSLLERVESQVMASNNVSLRIRYNRRLCNLRRAQHSYEAACQVQAQNLKMIAAACGRNNHTYAEELRRLMELTLDGKLWAQYLAAAEDMRRLHKSCLKIKDKQMTGDSLSLSFERSTQLAVSEVQKGNLLEIEKYLRAFGQFSHHPHFSIEVWTALFKQAATTGQDNLAQQYVAELLKLSADRSISVMQANETASQLLHSVLDDVYKETGRQSTESRLKAACEILERSRSVSELNSTLIYIQCKSLYALTQIRKHSTSSAELALDQISPGPQILRHFDHVTGIVQARLALGVEYLMRKEDQLARKQFTKLFKLMDQVSDSPAKQAFMKDLHERLAKAFS